MKYRSGSNSFTIKQSCEHQNESEIKVNVNASMFMTDNMH